MTETDLEREVRALIRERVDKGRIASATWATEAVVSQHASISGDDKEWCEVCAYAHIRTVVRRCVQKYKELDADEQLLLGDEFKRVQKAYLVERKKKQVIVPITLLTREELEAKVIELRKMGDGCYEHADELGRYIRERRAVA